MTAPARLDVFAPITKRERDPETGHLYIYGKMTGPDLDHDQQRMDPTWLKSAVPTWFKTGNIREMHQSKAVGKALELEEKDDGWYIGAKIVDKDAIEKIENDVLTGFSIGIKNPRIDNTKSDAPNGWITDGRICETSVVDSPCLPTAVFTMAKADGAGDLQPVDEPQLVEQTEQALPEIRSKADLRKAIRAVEDVDDDTERLRGHILTRAEALGLQTMVPASWAATDQPADLIPDNWNSDGSLKDADTAKADEPTGREASMPELTKNDDETAATAETATDVEAVAAGERILATLAELGLPHVVKADEPTDTDDGEPAGDGAEGDDETDDIAGAQDAIARIAALIISEAQSLAAGNLSEACDISCLLEAVAALKWFICRERSEDDDELMLADTTTAGPDTPDLVKTDQPAAQATTTDTPAIDKTEQGGNEATTLKAEIAEMVKAAVAEATTASEERIKSLEAELAQVKALPEPGGPVLTRTAVQEATARKADGDLLRGQAREYLAKAERASDPYLAQGYRDKATALLAKADA